MMPRKKKYLLWRPKGIIRVKNKIFSSLDMCSFNANKSAIPCWLVAKHLIGRRKCRVINYKERLPAYRHVDAHNFDSVRKRQDEFFVPFRLRRLPFTSCPQYIRELNEAKIAQEEKNMELQENFDKVTGKLESRNQVLKKEINEIQESQHKEALPPSIVTPRAGGRQMLTPPLPRHLQRADWELHASLTLGELCRQFQNKLYKIIFPNSFLSNRNYKMKNIWRDLDRLPQLEEEKQRSRKKWDEVKQKLKWDECYEDAMKALQESRNVDAHPTPLTEEGLTAAAKLMDSKGNLKGWLSLKRVNELITMWKNVQTME